MDRSRLAIVIPALNEAATIGAVLAQAARYGIPVLVDDGSRDATADIALAAGAQVVRHDRNQGYDGALNSGFARAVELGCEYAITMDADGQHNPRQLEAFIAALDAGADLVLGHRDRLQRIGETIFSLVSSLRWGIADPLCGMKGYRMRLYRQAGAFDTFQSIGTELAVASVVRGVKFTVLPVLTRDRLDAPRFGRRFSANYKLLRALAILLWRDLSGRMVRRGV